MTVSSLLVLTLSHALLASKDANKLAIVPTVAGALV